jgi:diguanylate cyclase (GGDEF)-like protein
LAVLPPQVSPAGALKAAEKILKVVAETPFPFEGKGIDVTVSCGISHFMEGEVDTIDTLIMEADRALYASKENGRNRVTLSREAGGDPSGGDASKA